MKKTIFLIFSLMLLFSMAIGPAEAQPVQRIIYIEEYEPIYSIDVDNDIWDIEMDDGDIIGVAEDGSMWFFMGDIAGETDLMAAASELKSDVDQYFTDINITRTIEDFTINGMSAYAYEATAKAAGKDVVYFVVLFQLETDDIGVLIFVMDPVAEKLHHNDIMRMTMSLARR